MMRQVKCGFRRINDVWFSTADAQIYGLIRIGFAWIAFVNFLYIFSDRRELFAPDGIMGQQTVGDGSVAAASHESTASSTGGLRQTGLSLFFWLKSPQSITVYCLMSGVAILCLGSGILTRPAAMIVFGWHLSYGYFLSIADTGWDDLLRVLSFVVMISPADRMWTVHNVLTGRPSQPRPLDRYGLVLIRLQVYVVYWRAVWLRMEEDTLFWKKGEFLAYYSLSIFSNVPSHLVPPAALFLCLCTYVALIAEVLIPILLSLDRWRWLAWALGLAIHGGIALTGNFNLWLFSASILLTYLAFCRWHELQRIHAVCQRACSGFADRRDVPDKMNTIHSSASKRR